MSFTKHLPWVAGIILALEPARWLMQTWGDVAMPSAGPLVGLLTAALFLWSVTSPGPKVSPKERRLASGLLILSALTRLGARVLAINIIGALTLVLDVFALASFFGLGRRRRRVSPGWLALLFALSLPIERVLQRVVGYGLQHLSAAGACGALSLGVEDIQCSGVRILLAGQDVQVGLPCSGARGLVTTAILFVLLAALRQPRGVESALGIGLWALSSVVGNILRITALALGIAYPEAIGGLNVMAQPWHDAIGLFTLALGALPLVLWARYLPNDVASQGVGLTKNGGATLPNKMPPGFLRPLTSLMLIPIVALVLFAPQRPIDVAAPQADLTLPGNLIGYPLAPSTLSPMETRYFTQYGGAAARGTYGPFGLLMVTTTSPLRHLHDPTDCLRGSGHSVELIGVHHFDVPAAVYRSTAPDGAQWRVSVTYFDDRGQVATSVSEVAYLWLKGSPSTWTAVQRITPWEMASPLRHHFEAAAAAATDTPNISAPTST